MIRSLIIDDEAKSRKLLKNLLNTYCTNVEIVGLADSVQSGLDMIHTLHPDLIFLDIILGDESAFDLLNHLEQINFEIIFTTAHHEYAIKAIRFSALDYLVKPLNIEELEEAVQKVEKKMTEKATQQSINQPLLNFIENQRCVSASYHKIGLPTMGGLHFVFVKEIFLCKAEGNYTKIFLKDEQLLVTKTLKEYEELLLDYNFFRVHRSYLINLTHIQDYTRTNKLLDNEGDGGCVTLINNLEIPVSRDKRKTLLNFLSKPF
ncbi:MAG: response regulator [Nitrosopumilaceae archaeon]|nr:response regulator transcription factor [Nitrosopumilaceae archaeon]NIU87196.1 response regulator [Nitrosopumilaceae archaeon]NIV65715.1 response regulator [Nitrosopumilaceae archaeon]NIX61361.1 response regulator [Nitrosopumilaceae archaeon]